MKTKSQLEEIHKKYTKKLSVSLSHRNQTKESRIQQSCYRQILDDIELEWNKELNSNLSKCTRVEVIDKHGRSYTNYNGRIVGIQLQDDERTLKVFIS